MIHRTTSCRGLKTEVPKGVAQQYVAQHPPIMSDLSLHGPKPVTGRGQLSGQIGDRPGGMMAQSRRDQPDRQRQIATQARNLGDRDICRLQAGTGG